MTVPDSMHRLQFDFKGPRSHKNKFVSNQNTILQHYFLVIAMETTEAINRTPGHLNIDKHSLWAPYQTEKTPF